MKRLEVSITAELANFLEKIESELEEANVKKLTLNDIRRILEIIKKVTKNRKYIKVLLITTSDLSCALLRSAPKRIKDLLTKERDNVLKESEEVFKELFEELERRGYKLLPYHKWINVGPIKITLKCAVLVKP